MYNYKTRECERCGKEIKATGGSKYCIQCRKERDDEIYKAQHERENVERMERQKKLLNSN